MHGLCIHTSHYNETLEPLKMIRVCPSHHHGHTLECSCVLLCVLLRLNIQHSSYLFIFNFVCSTQAPVLTLIISDTKRQAISWTIKHQLKSESQYHGLKYIFAFSTIQWISAINFWRKWEYKKCVMDLDYQSEIIILGHFWLLLKWVVLFEAAGAGEKIGSSLKPNYHNQVKSS